MAVGCCGAYEGVATWAFSQCLHYGKVNLHVLIYIYTTSCISRTVLISYRSNHHVLTSSQLSPSNPVVLQEHPEDPCDCVTVEIMVDGMALSKIMVHHQYATFDPAISSQEVWSVEISWRGFVLLVWGVDIDSVSFQDYVVKPPALDLDDWDLNTEVEV